MRHSFSRSLVSLVYHHTEHYTYLYVLAIPHMFQGLYPVYIAQCRIITLDGLPSTRASVQQHQWRWWPPMPILVPYELAFWMSISMVDILRFLPSDDSMELDDIRTSPIEYPTAFNLLDMVRATSTACFIR